MVLFIAGHIHRDLLFLWLAGVAQVRPIFFFFFFALQRKLKVLLFVTEDINVVFADQRTHDKERNPVRVLFSPDFSRCQ